jgi:uncharacterized membrane protein
MSSGLSIGVIHMTILFAGLALWILVHMLPTGFRGLRQALIERTGINAYKGLFSLLILLSVVLIVFGWRSSDPSHIYTTTQGMHSIAMLLILVAFLLLGASGRPTRIGRLVRHPQLTGVLVWCIGHLLANGDSRSLLLFGGIGVWSVLSMILINKRDGSWVKSAVPALSSDAIGWVASLLVMALLMYSHQWITGIPLM